MKRDLNQKLAVRINKMAELLDSMLRAVILDGVGPPKSEAVGKFRLVNMGTLSQEERPTIDEEGFPPRYDGKKGRLLSVRLLAESLVAAGQDLGRSAAQSLPDRSIRMHHELPMLNAGEVYELVSQVIQIPQITERMISLTGFMPFTLADDERQAMFSEASTSAAEEFVDGVDFKLLCSDSKDAHFVGRRLISHYVLGPEEHRFEVTAVRSVPRREDRKRAEEVQSQSGTSPQDQNQRRHDDEDSSNNEELAEKDSQHETDEAEGDSGSEGDLPICAQCHDAVDSGYTTRPRRTWARGLDQSKFSTNAHIFMQMKKDACSEEERYEPFEDTGEGEYGIKCCCHGQLFCNTNCFKAHTDGSEPGTTPEAIQIYRAEKNRTDTLNLLLLQTHQLRLINDRTELDEAERQAAHNGKEKEEAREPP